MPITDLWSYVTTGQDFETHWKGVNTNRTANALAELAMPDDYVVGDLTLDIAAISSANTDVEDLENGRVALAQTMNRCATGFASARPNLTSIDLSARARPVGREPTQSTKTLAEPLAHRALAATRSSGRLA